MSGECEQAMVSSNLGIGMATRLSHLSRYGRRWPGEGPMTCTVEPFLYHCMYSAIPITEPLHRHITTYN